MVQWQKGHCHPDRENQAVKQTPTGFRAWIKLNEISVSRSIFSLSQGNAMKVENTFTFIISKNHGRSLSFSMSSRHVYLAFLMAALLALTMLVLSLLYLLSYPRFKEMKNDYENLRQERNALREQILSSNQEALAEKESLWLVRFEDKTEGAGDNDSSITGLFGEDIYDPPIKVDTLTTRVNGRLVEVAFRLVNAGDEHNRGGFLYAIFENNEKDPVEFVSTPPVNLNEEGFPQTYKTGIRFTRIRTAVTFRRKVQREAAKDYFTHVTLYLFTVRGGLMLKERFELERDLFMQEKPVVRTQEPSRI